MTTGFAATASGGAGSNLQLVEANIPQQAWYPIRLGGIVCWIFDVAVSPYGSFLPVIPSCSGTSLPPLEYPTFVLQQIQRCFGFFLTEVGSGMAIPPPLILQRCRNGPAGFPSTASTAILENTRFIQPVLLTAKMALSIMQYCSMPPIPIQRRFTSSYTDVFVLKQLQPARNTMALVLVDIEGCPLGLRAVL